MDTNYEQTSLLDEQDTNVQRPVECLGLTFDSDEERRAYFLEILQEKLKDPEFRKIEGFPRGDDEDILALSDPPYYTACPNPFMSDFIENYGKPYDPDTPYRREPFAADVSEGKNDPIYNAHSYHTKVPHKAIMRYILHYTNPGDVVFDGFCGSGMTGVAAQMCNDRKVIESLGYKACKDSTILDENDNPFSRLGSRHAVLNDLSPAATFIAHNYTTSVDAKEFEREAYQILNEVEKELGWIYLTLHRPNPAQIDEAISGFKASGASFFSKESNLTWGHINYTVWSDVFVCSECLGEIILWDEVVDQQKKETHEEFLCPHCQAKLTKRNIERTWEMKFDKSTHQTIKQARQVPVLISYSVGKKRYEKIPDTFDLALYEMIENKDIPFWFPSDLLPYGYNTRQPMESHGITRLDQFYTKRNLWVLGAVRSLIKDDQLLFWMTAANRYLSKLSKLGTTYYLHGGGGAVNAGLLGTLFVPSFSAENSVIGTLSTRLPKLSRVFATLAESQRVSVVSTQSSSSFLLPDASIDYIFLDPPFGSNIMYSEINFLWETWLKVFTDSKPEAIENKVQGKGLLEYQQLMTSCFQEFYRILKPGRWMTVEFHNSRNSVWNAIQEALQHAGFIIADVRTLDKQQGTFKQVTSGGAVKQDLIISTYKPNEGLEERFRLVAGSEEGTWGFVRAHLRQLPVFVSKDGQAEVIAERMNYLLFDRMVAYHVQRGVTVPLSSSEFYAGLVQRFPERDGMYFLPDQVAEYDKKRITVKDVLQLQLFVFDESSAIQWLRQNLTKKPQTFQDIHPQFMKELGGWQKHEKQLELSELLEQNFLRYDGKGEVPSQIRSYLSTNFKDQRNLDKDDPVLHTKAKDRWYVPDPNKAIDLEKLREKALLKEFDEYKNFKGRQFKIFRLEAVRAGFKKAWQEHDYQTILDVARNIPDDVMQEDIKLLMWYDQAKIRMGDES